MAVVLWMVVALWMGETLWMVVRLKNGIGMRSNNEGSALLLFKRKSYGEEDERRRILTEMVGI